MVKILLLVAGIWLIYTLLKKYSRSLEKDEEAAAPSQIEEAKGKTWYLIDALPKTQQRFVSQMLDTVQAQAQR